MNTTSLGPLMIDIADTTLSDLDRDRSLELYVFSQLEAGWELRVIEVGAETPISTLLCGAK